MLNKFLSGLVIGLGFSVSFLIVVSLYFIFILPIYFSTQEIPITSGSKTLPIENDFPYIENFHELPLDDKIANSTAIIVTKIEKNQDGIYESKVAEVLKQQEGVELYYSPGDIYDDYSDYNSYGDKNRQVPQGFIVFMGGNPAQMRYSTSYSGGERISSLGDIPMALLREKCEKPST